MLFLPELFLHQTHKYDLLIALKTGKLVILAAKNDRLDSDLDHLHLVGKVSPISIRVHTQAVMHFHKYDLFPLQSRKCVWE